MDAEEQVYRDLQRHLDNSPTGFPARESGTDIRLLKNLLTPEEAKIAMQLSNIKPEPVKRIYRHVKKSGMSISINELRKNLDRMVYKGTILAYEEGYNEKRYKNTGVSAGGMIDFQVNRITQNLVDDLDKYHEESFVRSRTTDIVRILQLRTIPVEMSVPIPEKYTVSTYDNVRLLVQNAPGPISVANCVCQQMKDLRGNSCQYSDIRETCVKRCQLKARTIVNGVATVDLDRCIGCGNCVVTCESKASQLRKKEQDMVPPKDKDTIFMQIMSNKSGGWDMLKLRFKMLLGLRV